MQRLFRPIAILSITAYLLAVTCGVALHSAVHVHIGHGHGHTHAHVGGHSSHDHAHEHAGCRHHHHHGDEAEHSESESSAPVPHHHHDHDCVVCDFLAQAPAPVALVELPPDLEPIEPIAFLAATMLVPRPFSAWQGRAPPASLPSRSA